MCSHEEITWRSIENTVAQRMINNSLTHQFVPSQKIRKRTKLLKGEIKKRGTIKNYEQYVALKTFVLRKLEDDHDTTDTDDFSDNDYRIIHNSELRLREYRSKNSMFKALTSDEDEELDQVMRDKKINKKNETKSMKGKTKKSINIRQEDAFISQVCYKSKKDDDKKKSQVMMKMRENSKVKPAKKSTKKSMNPVQQKDCMSQSLFTEDEESDNNHNYESQMIQKTKKNSKTKSVEKKIKKSVSIGWQEVVKKNRNTACLPDNKQFTLDKYLNNSKQNISPSNECDHSKANSIKRSLSPKLEYQDSMVPCTAKPMNKNIMQKNSNSTTTTVVLESDSQSDSPNNTLCKIEPPDEDATINHQDSNVLANETNSMSNCQDNAVAWRTEEGPEEETMIQRESNGTANEFNGTLDEWNYSLNLELKQNDETIKSKLDTPKVDSSPVNNPPASVSRRQPSVLKDGSCEKPTEAKEEIKAENHEDACGSPKSYRSLDNVKKNLAVILNSIDSAHQASPNTSHDQQKDSGIDEDSQDKFVKRDKEETDKAAVETQEEIHTEDRSLRAEDELSKKQDTTDDTKAQEPETDLPRLNQSDEEDAQVKEEDETVKRSCNVRTKQLQPKITSTEIVSQKYRIVSNRANDVNVTCKDAKCGPTKLDTSVSCPNAVSNDTSAKTTNETQEADREEDEEDDISATCRMSPQTKKRLQRQARLNLTVDSDSSDSENSIVNHNSSNGENLVVESNDESSDDESSDDESSDHLIVDTSKTHTDDAKKSCIEDDSEDEANVRNDEAPEEVDFAASRSDATSEDACASLEDDERSCASEENDADASHDKDEQQEKKLGDNENSRASEESGIDISHDINNREDVCMNGEERPRSDEGNFTSQERRDECASSELQNVHLRPRNIEEFVEDQQLVVETLPAGLTLTDISEDEEAFIMNIPNKILQRDLRDQQVIMKGDTIRFGKDKFRVAHNEVSTVSCVFATGKQRKPYKIVNLKNISTITVGERLSKRKSTKDSDEPNCHNVDSFSTRKLRKRRHTSSSDLHMSDRQTNSHNVDGSSTQKSRKRRHMSSSDMNDRQTNESKPNKLKTSGYYKRRRRDDD